VTGKLQKQTETFVLAVFKTDNSTLHSTGRLLSRFAKEEEMGPWEAIIASTALGLVGLDVLGRV
jgi:hypothetical protein